MITITRKMSLFDRLVEAGIPQEKVDAAELQFEEHGVELTENILMDVATMLQKNIPLAKYLEGKNAADILFMNGRGAMDARVNQEKELLQGTTTAGTVQCVKCKSYLVKTELRQFRSGDEGYGAIHACSSCGKSWVG